MSRKYRRQRVALRFKRREQLKDHVRTALVRSVSVALVVGFGAGLVTGGDSFYSRFIRRHTPLADLAAPRALVGLPLLEKAPANRFWLWLPGSGLWLERRVCRAYPSVQAVRLERHFSENRVTIRPQPRIPLVAWNGSGFDRDGVLFAITPGSWDALAQATFLPTASKPQLARWLDRLSGIPELWPQVQSIRQIPDETLELTLRTGAVVVWGSLDEETALRKAQTLARVLDDAHKNMGGAARADLRFFDQGRIIVRPKGVRGE